MEVLFMQHDIGNQWRKNQSIGNGGKNVKVHRRIEKHRRKSRKEFWVTMVRDVTMWLNCLRYEFGKAMLWRCTIQYWRPRIKGLKCRLLWRKHLEIVKVHRTISGERVEWRKERWELGITMAKDMIVGWYEKCYQTKTIVKR